MPGKFKIAIASDLHVFSKSSKTTASPSWLNTASTSGVNSSNPLSDLRRLVESKSLKTDVLIVPGDITDKADPAGLTFGWKAVQDIKYWLSAKSLIATVGNHDLDSRGHIDPDKDIDPKGNILLLDPPFPCLDREMRNRYWAENFNIEVFDSVRIVNLNSCAYHGYVSQQQTESEHEHGRISQVTIERLRQELKVHSNITANILVMHHHPFANKEFDFDDREAVRNGAELIRLLSENGEGNWLIIHGHRHAPSLLQCLGSNAAPYALSAGSFSVQIDRNQLLGCDNQFYIVELDLGYALQAGGGVYGVVQSWSWATGEGWTPTAWKARIPMGAGFGKRLQPHEAAATIIGSLAEEPAQPYRTLNEICQTHPELRYVLYQDIQHSLRLVEQRGSLVTENSNNFWESQIFQKA